MSKFIIECPRCGKKLQAATGLFAKNKIKCTCGREIDISMEKIVEEPCPMCGSNVVYDISKPESAVCPACHTNIKSIATEEMVCPKCKNQFIVNKNANTCTCPQCKTEIDVQSRLAQLNNSKSAQIVKWDGIEDVFIYRHPVENFKLGSQLIVREGQKAVFFRNGQALDVFGPGRYTLETQNLPLLEEVLKYPTDADLTFDSQVYFVKTISEIPVKWGIPNMELRNPGMDFYVEVSARGTADISVIDGNENVRKFLSKVMGVSLNTFNNGPVSAVEKYDATYISNRFKDIVISRLGSLFADIIISNNINILDLASKKATISDILIKEYNEILEEYGLEIPPKHFSIVEIRIVNTEQVETWRRQESDRILKVRAEEVLKAEAEARQGRVLVEEQTEAQRKILRTQGSGEELKITAQAQAEAVRFEAQGSADATLLTSKAEAEATRLTGQASAEAYQAQAIAEAEEMRAKGYTYAQETSRQIGLEAMQNGLPGTGQGGSSSGGSSAASGISNTLGDMIGLGVGLSTLGGVVNITKDIMNPVMGQIADIGKQPVGESQPASNLVSAWNCSCGRNCITTKCCPDCGSPKPTVSNNNAWNCVKCGQIGITSNYCPNCGEPRPVNNAVWNCAKCGQIGVTTNHCPNCGEPIPVNNAVWNCAKCGQIGITSNYCPNCGEPKPVNNAAWNCAKCGQIGVTTNHCPNCGEKKGE